MWTLVHSVSMLQTSAEDRADDQVPRRRNAEESRERITASARRLFAERGYDRTTIRAVASAAGVAPALVGRYYPSKSVLFFASMPEVVGLESVSAGDAASLPERVARYFVGQWEDPQQSEPLHTWIRAAATDPDASRRLAELVDEHTIRPLASALSDATDPCEPWLLSALLVGTAYLRYVIGVEDIAAIPHGQLEESLIGAMQRLTGDSGDG